MKNVVDRVASFRSNICEETKEGTEEKVEACELFETIVVAI